jgi:hypothetical protein
MSALNLSGNALLSRRLAADAGRLPLSKGALSVLTCADKIFRCTCKIFSIDKTTVKSDDAVFVTSRHKESSMSKKGANTRQCSRNPLILLGNSGGADLTFSPFAVVSVSPPLRFPAASFSCTAPAGRAFRRLAALLSPLVIFLRHERRPFNGCRSAFASFRLSLFSVYPCPIPSWTATVAGLPRCTVPA